MQLPVQPVSVHKQDIHSHTLWGKELVVSRWWKRTKCSFFEVAFMFFLSALISILPSSALSETQFPKASGDNSSCDEDSNYSLSPEQSVSQESPLGLLPLPSPPETLTRSSIPSPTQVRSLRRGWHVVYHGKHESELCSLKLHSINCNGDAVLHFCPPIPIIWSRAWLIYWSISKSGYGVAISDYSLFSSSSIRSLLLFLLSHQSPHPPPHWSWPMGRQHHLPRGRVRSRRSR